MLNFPPLYECSVCGKSVEIIPQGEGKEPVKNFSCEHKTAIIWANRKVVCRGKGKMGYSAKIVLSLRQLLSSITGRSI